MLKFSIKNVFRKKTIAILSSLGVGFGLMLVFVLGAFTAGVNAQFRENFSRVLGQVQITEKLKNGADSQIPLDFPDKLLATKNVGEFITIYNIETQLPDYFTYDYVGKMENDGDRLVLKGLDKELDQEWEGATTKITNGSVFISGQNEIIVDSRLLKVAEFDVSIGSEIKINLDLGGTVTKKLKIVGIYEQEDNGAPSFVPRQYFIYTDILTAWNLLNDANEKSNIYSSISVEFEVQSNNDTQIYVDRINNYSEDGGYKPTFVSAISLGAFQAALEETFGILNAFTAVIGLIATISGGMAIIVTQLMSVSSRMKEFAILKATGWKNRHIFADIIYESLLLGLIGALIGLGLGTIMILLLRSGASPFGAASAIITIDGVIQVLGYALGLGVLGGLYPGIKAARVRPVVVLKGE